MKIFDVMAFEQLAERKSWVNQIHPMMKLIVVIFYLFAVASTDTQQIQLILMLGIFPLLWIFIADVPLILIASQMILPALIGASLGVFNVFMDREVLFHFIIPITSGSMAFLVIVLKSVFSVMCTLLLVSTTKLEDIGYAMEKLKIPPVFVTILLFVYRFLFLLIDEITQTQQAYHLRSDQRGIHIKVWGSLIGPIIIRVYERSQMVYEAMCLRGFDGTFYRTENEKINIKDILFLLCAFVTISYLRIV